MGRCRVLRRVALLAAVGCVASPDGTCAPGEVCGGAPALCTAVDAADAAAVAQVLGSDTADAPVLFRGGATHWAVAALGAEWSRLKEQLLADYGGEVLQLYPASTLAQVGKKDTASQVTNTTLREHFAAIEAHEVRGQFAAPEDGAPLHFDSESSLGARMLQDGLFDLSVKGGRTFAERLEESVLSLGGSGDGLPFHSPGATALGLVSGRKEWLFMAPGAMTEAMLAGSLQPSLHMDRLLALGPGGEGWPDGVLYCDQRPGDMLFFPRFWWHTTRNTGVTVALGGQSNAAARSASPVSDAPESLHEMELAALRKVNDNDVSEGLADLFHIYDLLPSKFSTMLGLVTVLHKHGQEVALIAQVKRLRKHLAALETREVISPHNLASLYAAFAAFVVRVLKDHTAAMHFFDESTRLDGSRAPVWHSSAEAVLKIPAESKYFAKGHGRAKEAGRRLKEALRADPKYGPTLKMVQKKKKDQK